ncbi:hypothetical protein NEOLEDRAFT_347444 [Neolentinus lepideus HHB14362 ss-1]|uniref:Uncharacterized protein n=1 Tax=Neolentinus lepideus HHB14362 ss-1 TaxID=1314782 RepID=A0A165SQM9_9AGAM|nr:hypothetical protein NEOLEDRAFT_347444 [Neolentinus lepideus HHB14362 ss-1]
MFARAYFTILCTPPAPTRKRGRDHTPVFPHKVRKVSESPTDFSASGARDDMEDYTPVICKWLGCGRTIYVRARRDIKAHLNDDHGLDLRTSTSKLRVECCWDWCGKQMNQESLGRHISETHESLTLFECKCSAKLITTRKSSFDRHIKTYHTRKK